MEKDIFLVLMDYIWGIKMTDKILYKVLCDDYEEVRRILFEIEETGEQIEGWYQIQKWVNSLFEENEKLKKQNNDLIKLINDLGSEEMDRQMEEILND